MQEILQRGMPKIHPICKPKDVEKEAKQAQTHKDKQEEEEDFAEEMEELEKVIEEDEKNGKVCEECTALLFERSENNKLLCSVFEFFKGGKARGAE
jgi:hypothetical protein